MTTPRLRTVRAENPSAMTFTGTNTYLLGEGEVVLIDPGPALPAHLKAILAALGPGERIAAILVTHCHLDHSALAPALAAAAGATTFAFGPAGSGRSPAMQRLAAAGLTGGGEGFDLAFRPDRLLSDGARLRIGAVEIEAIHTPGHTGCSLSFACDGLLFTGDLAMGWASSLISPPDGDMGDYLGSLRRLAGRPWARLLPGHGEPVEDAADRLAALIAHREEREAQVLAALTTPATPAEITAALYRDTPPPLIPAARRNVLAHLIHLAERGLVIALPQPGPEARFTLA